MSVVGATSRDVKQGVLGAAIAHGEDGKGKNGLQGFFAFLIEKNLRAFAGIISRLMPLQVNTDQKSENTLTSINIVSIPPGHFFGSDADQSLPPHEPGRISRAPESAGAA